MGARAEGTAVDFAGGGGGSIAGLSIHDGLAVTEDRCSVNSDEDELHGSPFLPSTSCTSRNGSIACYNIKLSPHSVHQLDPGHVDTTYLLQLLLHKHSTEQQQQQQQLFYDPLSRTTWLSWYEKKHSPTHTYPDHQPSFISFLQLLQSIASSLFNLRA